MYIRILLLLSVAFHFSIAQWTDSRPGPPSFEQPVSPLSKQIKLGGVVPNAQVTVVDANDHNVVIATGTSPPKASRYFFADVSNSASLLSHHFLQVLQQTTAGSSGFSSPTAFEVGTGEISLPYFDSRLHTCMVGLQVGGLTPGATVQVYIGSIHHIIDRPVDDTTMVFFLDQNIPLAVNDLVHVIQQAPSQSNRIATSEPLRTALQENAIFPADPVHLPNLLLVYPPDEEPKPLKACTSTIEWVRASPGSLFLAQNEDIPFDFLGVSAHFNLSLAQPLKAGGLVVNSSLSASCDLPISQTFTFAVAGPEPPGQPLIKSSICPASTDLEVYALQDFAAVTVSLLKCQSTNPRVNCATQDKFVVAASRAYPQHIPIPLDWTLDPAHNVLTVQQEDTCGQFSDISAEIPVVSSIGGTDPAILQPVYDCARIVQFSGGRPSTTLTLMGVGPSGESQLANEMSVNPSRSFFRTPGDLWNPIDMSVTPSLYLHQSGCNHEYKSPLVQVQPAPSDIPAPTMVGPVRPGATVFNVQGVLPGATVAIYRQNDQLIAWLEDAPGPAVSVPVLTESNPNALVSTEDGAGNSTYARQMLCNHWSLASAIVPVEQGTYEVFITPTLLTKGVSAQINFYFVDGETGHQIPFPQALCTLTGFNIEVVTDTYPSGIVYQSFTFPNPQSDLHFHVRDPLYDSYNALDFVLPVVQPQAPPPPHTSWEFHLTCTASGGLFGDPSISTVPVDFSRVVWTLTPAWNPSKKQTLTVSNFACDGLFHGSFSFPAPPPGTPQSQVVTVSATVHVITNGGFLLIDEFTLADDYDQALPSLNFGWDAAKGCSNGAWAVGYGTGWHAEGDEAVPDPTIVARPNECTEPVNPPTC